MKKFTLIILTWVIYVQCYSQQDPLYAQYMANMQAINPAYVGIQNHLVGLVNYRSQWASVPDHPTTITAGLHTRVFDYLGGGLMVIQDQFGVMKNTESHLMSSYQLHAGEFQLSFGLQFGLVNQQFDYSKLNLDPSANDPLFNDASPVSKLNIGTGLLLMSEKVFFGVSVPRLSQSVISGERDAAFTQERAIYAVGSVLVPIDYETELKPSVLFRHSNNHQTSIDVGLNWIHNRNFNFGVFTRNLDTYGLLLGARAFKSLNLQYSFEIQPTEAENFKNYSNEITVKIGVPVFSFHEPTDGVF